MHTVAVDANTGKELWRTKLGDINLGESITMAPIVAKGVVLVGDRGGEFGVRGWLAGLELSGILDAACFEPEGGVMPFCTTCGADVNNASFCVRCGTPVGGTPAPAAQPMMPAAQPPMPVAPLQPHRVSPVIWVIVGIAGFILLIGIVVASSGLFLAHRFAENPAMMTAKLLTAANPDVEVLSADQGQNTVTFRDKKTGETMTMNFDDIKRGKIVFKGKGQQEASVQVHGDDQNATVDISSSQGALKIGAGIAAKIPDWVPAYPGVTPVSTVSMQGNDADGGTFQFKTTDSATEVLSFYEHALKKAGFTITANIAGNTAASSGAMLAAQNSDSNRSVVVTAGTETTGAAVNVVFGTSKKP